jgi:hypothetical protein
MISEQIQFALSQVQELQQKILEKQRFKGYSGRARALSGTGCFLAAAFMGTRYYPQSISAHVIAWGLVFALALLLNFGAMLYWFLFDAGTERHVRTLKPIMDILPPIAGGGVLTLILMREGLHVYLFGMWMCLFGLANLAMRHALPRRIWLLGLAYTLSGIAFLMWPVPFLNPWPMGIVFFVGEWAAGFILHYDEEASAEFSNFLEEQYRV